MDGITPAASIVDPSISDWFALASGFGGALLGAVVGGCISYLLARQTNAETAKRDGASRLESKKGEALRLLIKSSLILSQVQATVTSIHRSLENANEHGMGVGPLWERMVPIIGSAPKYAVDASELSPFVEAKEYELVAEFIELVMQHDALNHSVELYSRLRMGLKELISHTEQVDGSMLFSGLTEKEHARILPHLIEIESLAADIKPRSERLLEQARKVTFAIGPAARKHFADPSFPMWNEREP